MRAGEGVGRVNARGPGALAVHLQRAGEIRYKTGDLAKRKPTWSEKTPEGRWRAYTYDELVERDKCSLDLFWLKDESLLDAESLPDPDVIAQEIAEDLRGALEQITGILGDLEASA